MPGLPNVATIMPCPYHADAPVVCEICGARCHGSPKGTRCEIRHDLAKHVPDEKPAATLHPPQWYDDHDED